MADNLTFTVNQQGPTRVSEAILAGGTTVSFLIVAHYRLTPDPETDNDFAGWVLSIPAQWENLGVDVTKAQAFVVNKPVRNGHVLRVSRYGVYYQLDTSFTLGSTAKVIDSGNITLSEETETTIKVTISGVADAGDITFAAAMTNFTTLDGMMRDFKGEDRQNASKQSGGTIQQKSWAQDLTYERLNMIFGMTTIIGSNYHKIMKWKKSAVPITITDNSTNKQIATYDGVFDLAPYPANDGMNPSFEVPVGFHVEAEVEA